jgi:DNA-binding transcriptional MerR regulator
MKRFLALLITFFLIIPAFISAQESRDSKDKQDSSLNSQMIDSKSKELDKQILGLYKNIEDIISTSNMMSYEGVKYLPYQTDIVYGPDRSKPQYVELIKHIYIKEGLFSGKLIGYEEKVLRIYSDGKTINKMETIIRLRNFKTQSEEVLSVVDPSPKSESKDDIIITHTRNGRKLVDQKKLGEIMNNIDLPIKNDIKAEFMIPNLVTLHKNLLFITESNQKSSKDVDMNVADFLKKSTYY